MQADTLAGGKINLPDAMLKHPAILTIGFSKAGGDATRPWILEEKKQFAGNSELRFYSVAVLQDAPKMVRGLIRHGMRGNIPKNEQDTFILIYEGEDQWKNLVGFSDNDDAYVVLVDASGTVRAKVHGRAPNAHSMDELKGTLGKISASAP